MRPFLLVLLLLGWVLTPGLGCRSALGQWLVGLEVGSDRYSGGSEETAPEHRSLRPYRPTTVGLGLLRRTGNVGAGVRFRYSSAGLALEGEDAAVVAKGVFDVYGVAPEFLYRVASLAANELWLHAGPLFEIWSVIEEGSEVRLGVHAGLLLRVPLGARLAGSLTAEAALIPSPFTTDQLDPGFERRALWRRRLAGGLEYRL